MTEKIRIGDPRDFCSRYWSRKLGDDISKGTELVIRVSPQEGSLIFESFDIPEPPKQEWAQEWAKQDAEGRLLLTPNTCWILIQDAGI